MKITHLYWSLTYGGIETMLINIVNEQVYQGEEVSVIIINDLCEDSLIKSLDSRVSFYKLGREVGSKNISLIIKLNSLLGKLRPDIIHMHSSRIAGIILRRKFMQKSCVTIHDLPCGPINSGNIFKVIMRKLCGTKRVKSNVECLNKIAYIFSISGAVKQMLIDNYGINSVVVPNGIITKHFTMRNSLIPHTPFRIVMVSRLEHEKKGQDLLIEAAAQLKGIITIDFIGVGSSMEYLKELTHNLCADNYIHFLGKQTQDYIASHLANYDMFIQPSRWEGFGLTVAEAMSARVPVLVSSGQGPAEVTCGNKYGWIFKNGDVNDLTNKISYIINHYNEAIQKAELAHQYVKENYDVSITAKKYLNEYKKIIEEHS